MNKEDKIRKQHELFHEKSKKRIRHGKYQEINDILYEWYKRYCASNIFPNGVMLKEEAMALKEKLQNNNIDNTENIETAKKNGTEDNNSNTSNNNININNNNNIDNNNNGNDINNSDNNGRNNSSKFNINENYDNIATNDKEKINYDNTNNKNVNNKNKSNFKNNTKKKKSVYIVGDSMVKEVNGFELSKSIKHKFSVRVRFHPSAKTSCINDHVKPVIRNQLGLMICHLIKPPYRL